MITRRLALPREIASVRLDAPTAIPARPNTIGAPAPPTVTPASPLPPDCQAIIESFATRTHTVQWEGNSTSEALRSSRTAAPRAASSAPMTRADSGSHCRLIAEIAQPWHDDREQEADHDDGENEIDGGGAGALHGR